ncbi:MAG: amino-acid N-acetyltransferase [Betaproteobacteria bacterium]|nr:amino-acid N-acetyltransferase [Betaproteobacteria bacterium]
MPPNSKAAPQAHSATTRAFVQWIRSAAPYIYALRGRTLVIAFGGEVVADDTFLGIVHDLNLLHSLGMRLVVVHGSRPQIEAILTQQDIENRYAFGLRITDPETMDCVLEASGQVRSRIEALLSLGIANSPMAGARIRVSSGNFLTAKPMGVVDGIDMQLTGEVRRVDTAAIHQRLDDGDIVLISPLGYSPTGEIFNLSLEEVATQVAVRLDAHKLVFLMETEGVRNSRRQLLTELSTRDAEAVLKANGSRLPADVRHYLPCAVRACDNGVKRAHLISRHLDGALLLELFTRDGVGTMIAAAPLANLRNATIDDVGGILQIIEPLEEQGVLVRRSRERLETEIERFVVVEHDGAVIGCAALYAFADEKLGELAALAVHPDFRREGYGEALVQEIENRARKLKLTALVVLTTRTAQWFLERGFRNATIADLPQQKQALYNYQRKSQVYRKKL